MLARSPFVLRYAITSTACGRASFHCASSSIADIKMPPKRKSVDKADEAPPAVSKKASKTTGDSTPAAMGKGKAKATKSTDGKGSSATTSPSGVAASGTAERPKRNKQGQLVFPDFPSELTLQQKITAA